MKILGESKAIHELTAMIAKVAATKTNVLVIGESGTGKELVARMIHDTGVLKGKPFVAINCGAIPESLIESELFGHRRGSFTGAVNEKVGLFEVATGGTLFLDEVGELPLGMQVKLLRATQERVFRRVGGVEDIRIDVRIIAATNRNLEVLISQGKFREDLYYRLNVIQIKTPPLRDRPDDIPLLAEHFLTRFRERFGQKVIGFQSDAMDLLIHHSWPGNVRELENVIERAVTLESGKKISPESFPPALLTSQEGQAQARAKLTSERAGGGAPSQTENIIRVPAPDFSAGALNLDEILGGVERRFISDALAHSGGAKKRAAISLGITFRSLRYRMQKLRMEN